MLGKRVRGALYLHRSAISALAPAQQQVLQHALDLAGDVDWNVVRLEPRVIGLLLYEDFESAAFPALLASTRVDLVNGDVGHRDFASAENPLILHRKEQLVAPETPGVETWRCLTAELEHLGCFKDPHLIGRRQAWAARLAAAGVRVEGHQLCPS